MDDINIVAFSGKHKLIEIGQTNDGKVFVNFQVVLTSSGKQCMVKCIAYGKTAEIYLDRASHGDSVAIQEARLSNLYKDGVPETVIYVYKIGVYNSSSEVA
jgi:hypothetical protein